MKTYFWLLAGAFVLYALYGGEKVPGNAVWNPGNYRLPITLHTDGHYYDADGKLVS